MNNIINLHQPHRKFELQDWRCQFEKRLKSELSSRWSSLHPYWKDRLLYSFNNGGKRVRALFIYAMGKAYNLSPCALDPVAQAVELIHTYSLVHDDLPAMDDDAFRRGYPSAHKAYNEADAILIGDGLLAEAFHILSSAQSIEPLHRLKLLERLSFCAGPSALVYGQWLDLYQNLKSFEELSELHHKKTGALFAFSLIAPAIIANKPHQLDQLMQIGLDLGLAFQIQDDILDLQPMSCTGKSCGKDAEKRKKTAVTFLGEDRAISLSDNLYQKSIQSLQSLFKGEGSFEVVDLIELLKKRKL